MLSSKNGPISNSEYRLELRKTKKASLGRIFHPSARALADLQTESTNFAFANPLPLTSGKCSRDRRLCQRTHGFGIALLTAKRFDQAQKTTRMVRQKKTAPRKLDAAFETRCSLFSARRRHRRLLLMDPIHPNIFPFFEVLVDGHRRDASVRSSDDNLLVPATRCYCQLQI